MLGISTNGVSNILERRGLPHVTAEVDDLVAQDLIYARGAPCLSCGKTFAHSNGNQKYCSAECKKNHNNKIKKMYGRMHPLRSVKISGIKGQDLRIRLSDEDREEIRYRHKSGGVSIRELAETYGVNRRLIQFVIYPERYKHAKMLAKIRRSDGRYKKTSEELRIQQAKHRAHKKEIIKLITKKYEP